MIIDTTRPRDCLTPYWNIERIDRGIVKSCIKDAEITCQKCLMRKCCLCKEDYNGS